MSKHESRRVPGATLPLQLALWEVPEPDRTNMVALYDIAPRFCFDTRDGGEGSRKLIEREFSFGSKRYRITLKPTQVRVVDGASGGAIVDRYLGEREQIVEEVIRRIAGDRSRLRLRDGVKVRFPFTIGEIRDELSRVRHSYSFVEIREAITLLNEVRLVIQDLDAKGSPVLSSAAFPVMGLRRRGDDVESFVEFNPLVADAIRLLDFMQVDYETLMRLHDPLARWLLKRLHNEIAVSRQPIQQMAATSIRRDSGMPEWKTTRNLLRRVSQSVELLRELGVLDRVDAEEVMEGQRKVDILFTVSASPDFMAKVHASRRIARANREDFSRITAGLNPGDGFAPAPPTEVFRLRDARSLVSGEGRVAG